MNAQEAKNNYLKALSDTIDKETAKIFEMIKLSKCRSINYSFPDKATLIEIGNRLKTQGYKIEYSNYGFFSKIFRFFGLESPEFNGWSNSYHMTIIW